MKRITILAAAVALTAAPAVGAWTASAATGADARAAQVRHVVDRRGEREPGDDRGRDRHHRHHHRHHDGSDDGVRIHVERGDDRGGR